MHDADTSHPNKLIRAHLSPPPCTEAPPRPVRDRGIRLQALYLQAAPFLRLGVFLGEHSDRAVPNPSQGETDEDVAGCPVRMLSPVMV